VLTLSKADSLTGAISSPRRILVEMYKAPEVAIQRLRDNFSGAPQVVSPFRILFSTKLHFLRVILTTKHKLL